MPALYAHKKFGALVYRSLPGEIKTIIASHKDEFLIGLHGPDVLFFHLTKACQGISDVGHRAHKHPFAVMMKRAYRLMETEGDEACEAYFFGCICHFVLDATCHPYVDRAIEETGLSHGKIEMELERYTLMADFEDPAKYPAYAHLPVSLLTAQKAAKFYRKISAAQFRHAMLVMKLVNKACGSNNEEIRALLIKIMEKSGQSGKIASLMMSRDMSRMAEDYVTEMYEKMFEAVPVALDEIVTFYKNVLAGERSYSSLVKKNFYGK